VTLRARIGEPAPDFELETVGGAILRPAGLRGRAALIVFLRHLY
jgi:hypothetical protein